MSSPQPSWEELLLNWGARIGAAAFVDRVKASQVENIIAALDVIEGREALLLTALFAQRQARRLGMGENMARLVRQAMLELYDKSLSKEEARKVLGIAKWVFEALQGSGAQLRREQLDKLTLKELLTMLRR
ncbi:MAG: hypothetical protein LM564_05525 [Desulfurococcaceae archaeon]|nr:hypothetical protein [Desulfurococcaceae archaeon]